MTLLWNFYTTIVVVVSLRYHSDYPLPSALHCWQCVCVVTMAVDTFIITQDNNNSPHWLLLPMIIKPGITNSYTITKTGNFGSHQDWFRRKEGRVELIIYIEHYIPPIYYIWLLHKLPGEGKSSHYIKLKLSLIIKLPC